jgi:hypothetical protein
MPRDFLIRFRDIRKFEVGDNLRGASRAKKDEENSSWVLDFG